MLLIFGGLPASGKSSISQGVARELSAAYVRVDTLEQTLKDVGFENVFSEGYELAYKIVEDNLALGLTVVTDSVNSIEITRKAWRTVGKRANVQMLEIEIICSDREEHQKRVESRVNDVDQSMKITWKDVLNRDYEPWSQADVVIDTAGLSLAQSIEETLSLIKIETSV